MSTPPKRRLSLNPLGEYYYKRGRLWAHIKNRPLSRLIVDVFESRVEANKDFIDDALEDLAKDKGVTVEEYIKEVLDRNDPTQ